MAPSRPSSQACYRERFEFLYENLLSLGMYRNGRVLFRYLVSTLSEAEVLGKVGIPLSPPDFNDHPAISAHSISFLSLYV